MNTLKTLLAAVRPTRCGKRNLKRGFAAILVGAFGLAMAGPANAYMITSGSYTGLNVGSLDSLLTTGNPNSSTANETTFVNDYLSSSFVSGTDATKNCDGNCNIYETNGDNVFAIRLLPGTPAYFMIKTGNGSDTGDDHFLFQNLAETGFAVFKMTQMGFTGKDADNIGKISHVTIFGTASTPRDPRTSVPAPNVLALMVLGLVMIGAGLRFSKRS